MTACRFTGCPWKATRRWLLLTTVLLTLARESLQDEYGDLWGISSGLSRRHGRRLLTRTLNLDEIFTYWQKTYAHWSHEVYDSHLSEYKRQLTLAGREWGLPKDDQELLEVYYFLRSRTQVPAAPGWTPERDRCAPGCHLYGTCHQELGRCDCPRGRTGPDCATPLATSCREYCQHDAECHRVIREWCINECNGRGSCVGGVCHCYPGYFGSDCALSIDYDGSQGGRGPNATVLLAGLNYSANPRGPQIFIYEFPPHFHLWGMLWVDRPLNIILWERITSLGLRELDPAAADYFFIPGCGRGCNKWEDKFQFIMTHYPQNWQRKWGRDHLVTHPGDWGRCEVAWGAGAVKYIANVSMLTHWGVTVDRSKDVEHDLFNACHKANQDILVPPMCGDLYTQFEYNVWHPSRANNPANKSILASVAGSLCGWNSAEEPPCKNRFYSFGVRAALWQLRDRPGFHIAKRVPVLGASMAESEFCFAPTGAGYGKRNVVSTTLGCIPVIISDHVAQPYEPFMNWNEFGVWIPENHINETEIILRGFTAQQKAEKMEKLHCAARHLAFTSVYGGLFAGDTGEYDAIATLVNILRARLRHPELPDHQLIEADPEFADFMACKPRGASGDVTAAAGGRAPPPPAPPLPNAALTNVHKATSDDADFPQRTVTTAAWIRAANGEAAGSDAGDQPGSVSKPKQLCMFNQKWVVYDDPEAPEPPLEQAMKRGQCMPKNANRPGLFFPGASVTCPPAGPITKCAQLV
ncbi:hypothetical protein Agub_g7227 [Astrephomene gubernaculifera]|uniref:EGF-like domain-containing protein n=1 Tax=Astrephomene gubernaculifera TaxID=47775 RepID=A0AAD3DSB0_9CHLO|nr:hypothetical protein Agub_g7227 [Astrephomene gubernaculifera]